MHGITWLASYPKSGNTWMRIFFTNLRRDDDAPASINNLDDAYMAADRGTFDVALGFETADLSHDEIDSLRPDVYRYLAERAADYPCFCKIHDAYTFCHDGKPLIPPDATAGVIYLIRNPLDVCVSYSHFYGMTCEALVELMADPHFALARREDRLSTYQLRQWMLTWSEHVLSWVNAPNQRILVLRYEDMKARPLETFTAAAGFVGMTQERAKITKALQYSSIDELQRQERRHGFEETLAPGRAFFRKGKTGGWREELTESQVARIIEAHREVMLRFGYLTEAGEPVF